MFFFKKKWTCAVCGARHKKDVRFCSNCGTEKKVYRDKYDAFISYRRDKGSEVASVIQLELEKFGKYAFLDVTELQVGRFDEKLLNVIEKSDSFILVLSDGSLDRCINKNDWLKREIIHAITHKKIIMRIYNCPVKEGEGIESKPGKVRVQHHLDPLVWTLETKNHVPAVKIN